MSKKNKIQPCVIVSREGLQANLSQLVDAKLRASALTVEMEQVISQVRDQYQPKLDAENREIARIEEGVYLWAQDNRAEFDGRKSIDFSQATIGFRTNPPAVEKIKSKENWLQIAIRLSSMLVKGKQVDDNTGVETEVVKFNGENYVRYADPAVDKEALIADRASIPAKILEKAGLRIVQDETFFITPKSDVVEGVTQEAA